MFTFKNNVQFNTSLSYMKMCVLQKTCIKIMVHAIGTSYFLYTYSLLIYY